MQWQATQERHENAFSARVDFRINDNWSSYVRVFHDQAESLDPAGRQRPLLHDHDQPDQRDLQPAGDPRQRRRSTSSSSATTRRRAPRARRRRPGSRTSRSACSGNVANAGIAGQGSQLVGSPSPGGLVRVNSAGNGRGAPYNPYSLTFADSLSRVMGNHYLKMGADVRLIRMTTDQLGGITYTFPNVTAFLANHADAGAVFRRPERAEPVPQRRDRTEAHQAGVLRRLRAGRMARAAELHAELRPPLRLLRAADGSRQPDRQVQHRHRVRSIRTRRRSTSRRRTTSSRGCRPPIRRRRRRCSRAAFGIFVGPGQTEDQIQPIEAERISTTVSSGPLLAYPVDRGGHPAELHEQPEQPVVPAARVLRRLHAAREGLSVHGVDAAGDRRQHGGVGRLRRQPGPEPVPPQHHEPDRRRAVERRDGGHVRFASSTS